VNTNSASIYSIFCLSFIRLQFMTLIFSFCDLKVVFYRLLVRLSQSAFAQSLFLNNTVWWRPLMLLLACLEGQICVLLPTSVRLSPVLHCSSQHPTSVLITLIVHCVHNTWRDAKIRRRAGQLFIIVTIFLSLSNLHVTCSVAGSQ